MYRLIFPLIIVLLLASCGQAELNNTAGGSGKPVLLGVEDIEIVVGEDFDPMAGVRAEDAEDGDISGSVLYTGSVDISLAGEYQLIYSVTDSSGNFTEARRMVVVVVLDKTAPVLTGVDDVVIFQGEQFSYLDGVSALDDTDGDLSDIIEVQGNFNRDVVDTYQLQYRVSDSFGNTTEVVRTITVLPLDKISPVISGATNVELLQGESFDPWQGISVVDNIDGDLLAQAELVGEVNSSVPGVYTLTYSAADAAGNVVVKQRTVRVLTVDKTAPVLFGVTDLTILQGETFDALAGVSASDETDGELNSAIQVTGSVNANVAGRYQLSYSVQDAAGNVATASRSIDVVSVDKTAPVISGAVNRTISVGDSFDPLFGVAASDDTDGDITNKLQLTGQVDVSVAGEYLLHYNVSDAAGNATNVTRRITVLISDTTAPVITGADDKYIRVGDRFDPRQGVVATDDVDGDISAKIQVTGLISVTVPGDYQFVYSVSDTARNTTVIVRHIYVEPADVAPPVFSGLEETYAYLGEPFDITAGVVATDDVDGDVTSKIEILGEVDTSWLGTSILIYSVQDSSGNIASETRVVRIIERDLNPPVLSGVNDFVLIQGYYFNAMQGVSAQDEVDGDLTSKIAVVGSVDNQIPGEYLLNYSVSDSSGNVANAARTIKVVEPDVTAPIFSGIANRTIDKGQNFDPLVGVSAQDETDGDVTDAITVSGSVDSNTLGDYVLSYRVSDSSGNTTLAACKVTVIPADETAPVFSGIADASVQEGGIFDPLAGVTAMDDRDGDVSSSIAVSGEVNTAVPASYVVTYQATDKAGNIAAVERTVIVIERDRIPPVITGAGDTIILQFSSFDPLVGVSAVDARDGDVTSQIVISGSVNSDVPGTYVLAYSVSDSAGNESQATRNVVVEEQDLVAPVISGVNDVRIAKDAVFNVLEGVSANDNIDGDVSANIKVTGEVNSSISGNYTLTYRVQDSAANETTTSRVVTVNSPPQFTTLPSAVRYQPGDNVLLDITASDANGDVVGYSVSALPAWLSYNAETLQISGVVSDQQLGSQVSIVVTASDDLNVTKLTVDLRVAPPPPAASDVHRLLVQATFGPTPELLTEVQSMGIEAWVEAQLNMGSAYDSDADNWKTHLERTIEIAQQSQPGKKWFGGGAFNRSIASEFVADYQISAWWDNVLGSTKPGYDQVGSDQLRQRVAYALSQLLVTSAFPAPLNQRAEAMAYYYDLLAKNAFGNYRDLLGDIARSPAMGVYLSHQGNAKADLTKGTRPDENFAREVMQLFTIGLYQMNRDGSPDRDGNPSTYPDAGSTVQQSYQQTDVEELAKVMTGWDLVNNGVFFGYLFVKEGDYTQQMEFNPRYHEDEVAEGGDGLVTVLGQTIALNSGADGSGMDAALDVLFNHQNTAPFVSRSLIQRLVTSNPSPAYIARVASVFENNGQGVRGDLQAVVRAILLDEEARSATTAAQYGFGKAKEPIMAFAQVLRATNAKPLNGWKSPEGVQMSDVYWYPNAELHLAQAPMRSQSVFNFYQPDFVPVDTEFQQNSWAMPETQIQSGVVLVEYGNLVHRMLSNYEENKITKLDKTTVAAFALNKNSYKTNGLFLTSFTDDLVLFEQALEGDSNGDFASMDSTVIDADGDTPKANAIDALLDHIDSVLLGGSMTPEVRGALKHYLLDATGTNTTNNVENALTIIRDAYHLISISSLYMIQK